MMLIATLLSAFALLAPMAQAQSYLYVCGAPGASIPTILSANTLPCPAATGFLTTSSLITTGNIGLLTLPTTSASISFALPVTISTTSIYGKPVNGGLNVTFSPTVGPIPEFYKALLTGTSYKTVVLLTVAMSLSGSTYLPVSAYILTTAYITQINGGSVSSGYSVSFIASQLAVQSWTAKPDGTLLTSPTPSGVVTTWDWVKNAAI